MSGGFNWADYGSEQGDLEKSTKDAKERRQSQNARKRQKRLWLPVNAEKKVIILDDDPFRIDEHSMLINGTRKGNWFTCIKKLAALAEDKQELKMFKGGCPFCSINEPYFVGFVTVLVVTPFRLERGPDKGKTIKNYRNLLPMKLETLEWFHKEKRDRKSLVGALYRFSRTKKQGQAAFGVPSFLQMVTNLDDPKLLMPAKDPNGNDITIPPVAWTKEEYSKMFEPLAHTEMAALAKEIRAGSDGSGGGGNRRNNDDDEEYGGDSGGGSDDSGGGGDDEIPF